MPSASTRPLSRDHLRRIDAGMAFIRRNYQRRIRLDEIAATVGLSPYYFHRIFRRHFGRTPKRVITELQVAEAQRLMAGGAKLGAIAARFGFSHQAHFTHRFKQLIARTAGQRPHTGATGRLHTRA